MKKEKTRGRWETGKAARRNESKGKTEQRWSIDYVVMMGAVKPYNPCLSCAYLSLSHCICVAGHHSPNSLKDHKASATSCSTCSVWRSATASHLSLLLWGSSVTTVLSGPQQFQGCFWVWPIVGFVLVKWTVRGWLLPHLSVKWQTGTFTVLLHCFETPHTQKKEQNLCRTRSIFFSFHSFLSKPGGYNIHNATWKLGICSDYSQVPLTNS